MNKIILSFVTVTFLIFGFQSCKDDPETSANTNTSKGLLTDAQKAKLLDKVWYSNSGSGGIEHEFLTDGTLRLSLSLEGRYNWINKGDTMDILHPSGGRYRYLFKTIGDHEMSFSQNEDNYKEIYAYRDTE